jgi:hypothetical protein
MTNLRKRKLAAKCIALVTGRKRRKKKRKRERRGRRKNKKETGLHRACNKNVRVRIKYVLRIFEHTHRQKTTTNFPKI